MQVFTDETEFTDYHMIQRVVGMFESHRMQRIVACGLLGIDYDDLDLDDFDPWPPSRNSFHGYQGDNRGLSGNHTRLSGSVYQPLQSYYTPASDPPSPSSVKVQAKESASERKARLLQESKKSKEKAEKKRLKKQKQKQRKQMEKEKQDDKGKAAQPPKAEDCKSVNEQKKNDPDSSVKPSAAAKDTDSEDDSSELESSDEEDDTKDNSGDSEELDITSTFVSKAALIAKRQLEQKSKSDKREKKKSPEKEKIKRVPDKLDEDKEAQKKYSATASSLTFEDNVKISRELAVMGNKFASEGDYNMAVKYFTDAIKYNPKEFKLFGNRSFCFEKLQEYEKALTDAELSLGICPGWVKGMFRKGRALAGLKRYEEAAQAFRDVLRLDSSYAEAAQELMRVQIIQLMEYGFTREQSSNALIIHGNLNKAFEVLSKLNHQPGAVLNGAPPPAQVVNVTGVSPVLSANTNSASAQPHDAFKKRLLNAPLGPVYNIPDVGNQPKPVHTKKTHSDNKPPPELFPVWVGNLIYPITESAIIDLFSKAGDVISVKILSFKRCAFVNFAKQEHCDEAIRRFHGCALNGMKLAVRYPDRIPAGMGISRSALRAHDLLDENLKQNAGWGKAAGSQKYFRPYKPD